MKHQNLSDTCLLSGAERTKHSQRAVLSILVLGILLLGCSRVFSEEDKSSVPSLTEFTFEEYEIVTGIAKRQTLLTGFLFSGDFAELVAVSIDENGNRNLCIYTFTDGTWLPRFNTALHPEVLFVDVANINGRDRLIMYEQGHLNYFDPELGTTHPLVAVTANFNPPRKEEIPHVDITRDLNADGHDDFVVPEVDGFSVFIQLSDGTFAEPLKIGPSPEMSGIYGADGYRYDPWSQSRIHEIDYNQDGRGDLVFWDADHFKVHRQNTDGLFSPTPTTFTTDVIFDSDELASLTTGGMTGKVLHALADLNGDGVADLMVFSLEGEKISSKRSAYEVHFGESTPDGGTVFGRDVDIAFQSNERIQLGMTRHDFKCDNQVDLMIPTIRLEFLKGSLWKSIKGFMGDDIYLDLEFYHKEDGRYADTPNTIRRIALDGVPSHREPGWVPLDLVLLGATHKNRKTREPWRRAFNTTLRIGDVTGDGLSDVVIGDHPRIMSVFVGVPGPELFAQHPQNVAIAMPNDEEYTRLVDLNKDGTQDILMHHPFTLRDAHGAPVRPPGTEPHRVTLLIAR